MGRGSRLLSDILSITPTGLETWARCRRQFLLSHLLGVPPSDPVPTPDRGQFVHRLLQAAHEHGSCHDAARVDDLLVANGGDDSVTRAMFERHVARCPLTVDQQAHETDIARFHRFPAPMFMANARIDAVWVHDGILDARDYKTGRRWYERVADDPSAWVQAYVLAPLARRRGLRVRVRYEYLAPEVDDDPEPFEPDDDDLEQVEAQLHAAVSAMWEAERDGDWRGCADENICRTCRFRSICPDSVARGEPEWAVLGIGDV